MADHRETVRLFVAVDPPALWRDQVVALVAKGKQMIRDAKWVRAEGLHLTLAFLGDVSTDKQPAIQDAMDRTASRHATLWLAPSGLGVFGAAHKPRVLWLGVTANDELAALRALQADVQAELESLGFLFEKRSYSPHITLARGRGSKDVGLSRYTELAAPSAEEAEASSIVLYESAAGRYVVRHTSALIGSSALGAAGEDVAPADAGAEEPDETVGDG